MSIKIATVNIEHGRHLPDLYRFIAVEQPDVLCLQEVVADDVAHICEELGCTGFFAPISNVRAAHGWNMDACGLWGELIVYFPLRTTLIPFSDSTSIHNHYYLGVENKIPDFVHPAETNRVLQVMIVRKDGEFFIVGNTHFTWSANGLASKTQFASFNRLAQFLDLYPELLLCGDFNAPRGGEIFSLFTQRFTDNIPPEVVTTIDSSRHYSGRQFDLVVDNIFSTSQYKVHSVRVIGGVSDHYAVVGEVEKIHQDEK